MNRVPEWIQRNWVASAGAAIVMGLALWFMFNLLRHVLSPLVVSLGKRVGADLQPPEAMWMWAAAINFFYSAFVGLLASALVLGGMQYFLRPKILLWPQVSLLVFVGLNYRWFVENYSELPRKYENAEVWVMLIYPLGAFLVFILCSLWLVKRNQSNNGFNKDASR